MTDWESCAAAIRRDVDRIHETLAAPCPDGVHPTDWEIHKGDLRMRLAMPGLLADAIGPPEPPPVTMEDLMALYREQMAINQDRWRAAMAEADGTTIHLHGRDVLVRYRPDIDPDSVYFLDKATLAGPVGTSVLVDGEVRFEWGSEP